MLRRSATHYVIWIAALGLLSPGCSSDDDDESTSCVEASGTWNIGGGCLTFSCTIAQAQCSLTTSCTWGTLEGVISGDAFTVSDSVTTCSGNVNGNAMSGSCTGPNGECSFTGNRTGG